MEPYLTPFNQFLYYLFTWKSFIDFLTIIPSYTSIYNDSYDISFAFVRVIRLFRIIHLNKRGQLLGRLFFSTLNLSREAISMFLVQFGIIILIFATIIYSVEKGTFQVTIDYPNGAYLRDLGLQQGLAISPFSSISVAIYYAIITATTVGYGDITTVTSGGRAVASVLILIGVIFVALPISIIGSNFKIRYKIFLNELKIYNIKEKLKRQHKYYELNHFETICNITNVKNDETNERIDEILHETDHHEHNHQNNEINTHNNNEHNSNSNNNNNYNYNLNSKKSHFNKFVNIALKINEFHDDLNNSKKNNNNNINNNNNNNNNEDLSDKNHENHENTMELLNEIKKFKLLCNRLISDVRLLEQQEQEQVQEIESKEFHLPDVTLN